MKNKILIAGWFSFEHGHATAGDILSLQVTCDWIDQTGYSYDIAFDPPFKGGINWRTADPVAYSHVIFVCGPFEPKEYEATFLSRFKTCRLIGLNLSMPVPLTQWNPFDLLLERNSSSTVRPDIVFASNEPHVPVVGICLVEPYPGALDAVANTAINRLVDSRQIAIVYIDTRLDCNSAHLRSPAEIESLIARVDLLITTRLHGMVLALKNNVPVVAIDPEAGGAKIIAQAKKIDWPMVFQVDNLTDEALQNAFDFCLTNAARIKAQQCRADALAMMEETRQAFILDMVNDTRLTKRRQDRLASSDDWTTGFFSTKQSAQKKLQRIKSNSTALIKKIAYWTLPSPIFNAIFY